MKNANFYWKLTNAGSGLENDVDKMGRDSEGSEGMILLHGIDRS